MILADITSATAFFLIKVAILLQYLRVFVPPKTRNAFFWICHSLIWSICILYLTIFFSEIFECSPIKKLWKPWIEGHCVDFSQLSMIAPVFSTVSDLAMLILPQHVIWNLHMTLKKKLGISALFLIGIM